MTPTLHSAYLDRVALYLRTGMDLPAARDMAAFEFNAHFGDAWDYEPCGSRQNHEWGE